MFLPYKEERYLVVAFFQIIFTGDEGVLFSNGGRKHLKRHRTETTALIGNELSYGHITL